ncbi:FkbM family methyltransferase [Peptococcaceae bacterium]|nr:FkbM family methyltransferase [Peptococcaceae bacterium]
MKVFLKKIIPNKLIAIYSKLKINFFDGYAIKSYSQEGEDMILRRIFERQKLGFYVDIGAHHPKRFSNTYYFYKKGWRGINIDALPGTKKLFDKERPRDINIEIGVSLQKGEMTYYMFNEPALNSFNEKLSLERINTTNYKLLEKKKVKVDTLKAILKNYLPQKTQIDFMSIDVEGLDMEVLKSNDWEIFRPKYLLIESLNSDMSKIAECPIYQFLSSVGYKPFAKTFNTYIYKSK